VRPKMLPRDFAQEIANEYINFYKETVEESTPVRKRGQGLGTRSPLDLNKPDVDLNFDKAGPDLNFDKAGPDLNFDKAGPDLNFDKAGPDLGPREGPKRRGIDLSACSLGASGLVVAEMAQLVELLTAKLEEPQVLSALLAAHSVSQSYFNQDFTDLHDFCRWLQKFSSDSKISNACGNVMNAIKKMCPDPGKHGDESKNSNGVSIFFPWGEWGNQDVLRKYVGLKFLKETAWNTLLENYRAKVHKLETEPLKKGKAA
jgi:hypothetical protein